MIIELPEDPVYTQTQKVTQMRMLKILTACALVSALASPVFAMDSSMMEKGSTMMMMPDGKMGTMKKMDSKMSAEMMKTAKPMNNCMMMMMGDDGKMYMVDDMKMADGKMACETMMMAK